MQIKSCFLSCDAAMHSVCNLNARRDGQGYMNCNCQVSTLRTGVDTLERSNKFGSGSLLDARWNSVLGIVIGEEIDRCCDLVCLVGGLDAVTERLNMVLQLGVD